MATFPAPDEAVVSFVEHMNPVTLWVDAIDVFYWLTCAGYEDLASRLAAHLDAHPEHRLPTWPA